MIVSGATNLMAPPCPKIGTTFEGRQMEADCEKLNRRLERQEARRTEFEINARQLGRRAFEQFPIWIQDLAPWKVGFTLTYRDKEHIPDDELNGNVEVWNPSLKWVKYTMENWSDYQLVKGTKFVAILEKGKLGTERFHIHGLADRSIQHWNHGFWKQSREKKKGLQEWTHYIAKYMLKDPLGLWSRNV